MHTFPRLVALCLAAFSLGAFAQTISDDVPLTGDARLACEAMLCLSSGQSASECQPSLRRYFSIVKKTASKTQQARRDFFKSCASACDADVNTIVDGSGRCDAAALNAGGWFLNREGNYNVSDKMPAECVAYYGNTGVQAPKYIGTPEHGGYWATAATYAVELKAYNDRLRKEGIAKVPGG
jgi:hypothetical protein